MKPQVLLLMAGQGSRFRKSGYVQSKPLIPVDGVPMFEHALSGVDDLGDFDLTVVVRSDQIDHEQIDEIVRRTRPAVRIVEIPALTRGAAETALAAAGRLEPTRPLIVLDCDLRFRSNAYISLARAVASGVSKTDAVVLTFAASDPRYSYALVGEEGRVEKVAEKQVISDRAIAGAYLFRSAELFKRVAAEVVASGLGDRTPEFYLSAVIEKLLTRGRLVTGAAVDEYESYGTPDELESSLEARHAG